MSDDHEKTNSLRTVDLFCGAGGLSLGFEREGFEILCAVDFDGQACETYERNFEKAEVMNRDIREMTRKDFKKFGDIDVVLGGPPCQGFSQIGKRNPEDERNNMVFQFIRMVDELQPSWFLMENVYGLASMQNGKVVEKIKSEFSEVGYVSKWRILNSVDYGVPQKRRRLFFMGNRHDEPIMFPPPTHSDAGQMNLSGEKLKPYKTVRDAFKQPVENLPNHAPPNHSEEMVEKIENVEPGKKLYPSRSMGYFRLKWDSPSWAVAIAGGGEGLIHPSEDRVISPREAARLQIFPDDFIFKGNKGDVKQQISNAVPPKLAEALAKKMKYLAEKLDVADDLREERRSWKETSKLMEDFTEEPETI